LKHILAILTLENTEGEIKMANPEKLVPYSTQGETFYLSACTKQEK
jgi:hypothetical protein